MKKNNGFLLAIIYVIIGIIFTSCWLERVDNYCPYCKSSDLKLVENINIAHGVSEKIYQCNNCGKAFGVVPYYIR